MKRELDDNRFAIVGIFMLFLFSVLIYKYARLTLVEGEKYRDISDEKRVRTIITTAPRGEIRDRNGVLLAGNRASFTVQLLKDSLNQLATSEKNEVELSLIRLLEEDGVHYLTDYPIELNSLSFVDSKVSEGEVRPLEIVIDAILEHNLLSDILNCDFSEYQNSSFYRFVIGDRLVKAIKDKEGEVPLLFSKNSDGYVLSFYSDVDVKAWGKTKEIDSFSSPYELLKYYVDKDRSFLRKTLSHPIARKAAFQCVRSKGLCESVLLNDFSIGYDDEYARQKRYLMTLSPKVSETSSATEDFLNVFKDYGLTDFVEKIFPASDSRALISIQQEMIKFLKEKNLDVNLEARISDSKTQHTYAFRNGLELQDQEPSEYLLELLKKNGLLEDFLLQQNIRFLAQEFLIAQGINTRISITELPFEYVSMKEKNAWLREENIPFNVLKMSRLNPDQKLRLPTIQSTVPTAEQLFRTLKERQFSFSKNDSEEYKKMISNLSDYEIRGILAINRLLKNQGYRAFQPINFAYGISDKTVARLKEGFGNKKGIQISVEPVRYYPYNQVGSHILGYIGKISQSHEIEKYVEERGYHQGDLVGKTGLEEYFEDILRGQHGKKVVEIDAHGYTTAVLEEVSGKQGNTLYTSHDIKLQEFVEQRLIETMKAIRSAGIYKSEWGDYKYEVDPATREPYPATTGVSIVQKVDTGEILAMASVPSFNPNLFATGISSDDFMSLFPENEKDMLAPRPLYNIATQTAIQPGSIFKMITSLAALEKGWNPKRTIRDMGYVEIGDIKPSCWFYRAPYYSTHGQENLADAIKDSCNYYFFSLALGENQRTGEKLGVRIGIEDIIQMAEKFGLNDKTGVEMNIPVEAHGGVPAPEKKEGINRSLLNRYLNANIKKYARNLQTFHQERAIQEILSWFSMEQELSRSEIIRRLTKLGLEPTKPLEGRREGLADLIKYTYMKNSRWNIADTLNVTIGQGQNAYTPLQISNYISTLANGGKRYKVTLVDSIRSSEGNLIRRQDHSFEKLEFKDANALDDVKEGMEKLVTEGAIKNVFQSFPLKVAAKTGSAEKDGINPATGKEYVAFAWFVAYAPADKPEIAVTTLIFQGRSGGNAAPMTRDIIAEYFGLKSQTEQKEQVVPIEE